MRFLRRLPLEYIAAIAAALWLLVGTADYDDQLRMADAAREARMAGR
jgi:hypothetical protein